MNAHIRWIVLFAMLPTGLSILGGATEPPEDGMMPDDLLRGPTVPDSVVHTLVDIDARGSFVKLQGRPVEAALELALIDPERRQQAREAVAARRTALGMLLVDKIDQVRDAGDAIKAGEREKAQATYREFQEGFDPDQERDPLLRDFAEILTPPEQDEVQRLVDEYWDAWIRWEMRNSKDDSDSAKDRVERRLSFSLFQQEIGQAYNWSLRPFRNKLGSIYEITEATEEQRTAMRDVVIDYIRESRLQPTPEQRQRVSNRIHDILDDSQRRRLFDHALWQL